MNLLLGDTAPDSQRGGEPSWVDETFLNNFEEKKN